MRVLASWGMLRWEGEAGRLGDGDGTEGGRRGCMSQSMVAVFVRVLTSRYGCFML